MHQKKAKILCLVPSWTETLLEAGAEVVGRTRFCVHPADKVASIPAVGGTKNFKLDEVLNLSPDFVVLDREENTLEMANAMKQHGIQALVSHVTNIAAAADFLAEAAQALKNEALADYARRYRELKPSEFSSEKFWRQCVLAENSLSGDVQMEYVIWKNPYMVIGQGTFIADVLSFAGVHLHRGEKYPVVTEMELKMAYTLFSSEPYPFAREFEKLKAEGFRGRLVDGEKISWYGIRNLKFMESCRK